MTDIEVQRLIAAALHAAGVRNVATIERPDGDSTGRSVLLEDSSTTIAAVRALKSLPGVTQVRRRPFRSHALTVEQAAVILGCGRTLAYELIRRGEFPTRVVRPGSRRYVIPTADLLRLVGIEVESGRGVRDTPTSER